MDFLLNKYVLGGIAIVAVIGGLAYAHSRYVDKLVDAAVMAERGKWEAAITKQKAEAQAKLDQLTQEVAQKEAADLEHSQQLEQAYVKHVKSLNASLAAAKSAKLHDPGTVARSGSGSGCATEEGKADTPKPTSETSEGELSPVFTGFLIGEASRADEVALVANTCLAFIHDIPQGVN